MFSNLICMGNVKFCEEKDKEISVKDSASESGTDKKNFTGELGNNFSAGWILLMVFALDSFLDGR